MFSDAPSSVPLPGEAETPAEAGSSPSPTKALPSNLHGSEARTTKAARGSPSKFRPLCIIFASSSKPWTSIMPTLVVLFYGYPFFYLLGFPVFFYNLC